MTDVLNDPKATPTMRLGYTMSPGPGDTDLLLARCAEQLDGLGVQTCGTVQINTRRPGYSRCDMNVKLLPEGPVMRISQTLGREARGCRLDPSALETAVAEAARRLEGGADVLIINKFGKHEAEGRGFRALIADALAAGIPVLVGVNPLNLEAFLRFSDGISCRLDPDPETLLAWVLDACGRTADRSRRQKGAPGIGAPAAGAKGHPT